ncbi:MAG: AraC family transcriptional regulator [Streptosporangiaceae bacterium]|nr:AraC family transcriptional regulator [Streptosporangiaceae bacterium]MBV9857366.1 AraC family transcriptional regulator [Streptosporangiaceae bacterium]
MTHGAAGGRPAGTRPAREPVRESVRRLPAPALRPFVAWYSGYRQAGVPPAMHRGLPSPELTLIVTLEDPLVIAAHPDPRQPAGEYDVLIGGLHTTPALITHEGRQAGVQLGLTPLGARALLGMPAGELAAWDVHGADVLGRFAAELRDRVRAAASWPARFAVIDDLLARRAETGASMRPEVSHAWHRLLAARGAVPVSALAEQTGWSARHLTGQFRAETGLTPKAAARVMRFTVARRQVQRLYTAGVGEGVGEGAGEGAPKPERPAAAATLADLAAACGYYDQAHLARDFRDLAGCPPSVWFTEEFGPRFRNVQATPAGRGESSAA